ncbi:MAG TPA: hypothetical protein PLU82_07490 [Oscillospiraceae bacterium]|nr:hypothetical protein [Oscillospiraceae bacterium]
MSNTMTAADQKNITAALLDLADRRMRLAAELSASEDETGAGDVREQLEKTAAEFSDLLGRYLNGLPVRPLSRCPFTGEVLSMAVDDFGLNGFFWNNDAPKRPRNRLPETYFAMDGALKLAGKPEPSPLLCCPGPGVPYVLPRLLRRKEIKAVISCLKVGTHTGYPIFYYADPMPDGVLRVNDWGTERYWEPGSPVPGSVPPGLYVDVPARPEEMDFDLASWIRAGKLLWIAPEDAALTLHSGISRCPYLDLPGSRRVKYIQNGEVWEDDEEEASPDAENAEPGEERFEEQTESIGKGAK